MGTYLIHCSKLYSSPDNTKPASRSKFFAMFSRTYRIMESFHSVGNQILVVILKIMSQTAQYLI